MKTIKIILPLLITLLIPFISVSQQLQWAKTFNTGNTGNNWDPVLAVDNSGNILIAGTFMGSLDVQSPVSQQTVHLTSAFNSAYLVKFSATGSFMWSKIIPDSMVSYLALSSLHTDPAGNIYLTGINSLGTLNFNAGGSSPVYIANPTYNEEGFIAKYSSSGALMYAQEIPSNSLNTTVAVTPTGISYLLDSQTNSYDNEKNDLRVSRIDDFMNTVWQVVIPKFDNNLVNAIDVTNIISACTDSLDNLYILCNFEGPTFTIGRDTIFILKNGTSVGHIPLIIKFDKNGTIRWAHSIYNVKYNSGGTQYGATSMSVDGVGNMYVSGIYSGSARLGPNGEISLYSNNWQTELIKYDSSGALEWGKSVGGNFAGNSTLSSSFICLSANRDIYVGGNYTGTVNFNPSTSQYALATSYNNGSDGYVLQLNKNGNYKNVSLFTGGKNNDRCLMGAVLPSGNIAIMGIYEKDMDIDPGATILNVSNPFYSSTGYIDGLFLAVIADNFNTITGKLFLDKNKNGVFDSSDFGLKGNAVTLLQSDQFEISSSSGNYSINCGTGSFTLQPKDTAHYIIQPASYNLNFSSTGNIADGKDFAYQPIPGIQDLAAYVLPYTAHARPGFNFTLAAIARNAGTDTASGFLTVKFNPALKFNPGSLHVIAGSDSVSIPFSQLPPRYNLQALLSFTVPSSIALSDTLFFNATVYDTLSLSGSLNLDHFSNNDYDTTSVVVTGSFDPNEKTVAPSGKIPTTPTWLTYTIHFQNTGTDTAFRVVVADTLSTLLDLSTFSLVESSFPCSVEINPAGVAFFTFTNINLPDSFISRVKSIGYLQYKIRTRPDAPAGGQVSNKAYIYFDFNSPIVTNTAVSVFEGVNGVQVEKTALPFTLRVLPNPLTSDGVLVISVPHDGNYSATLSDITGKTIKTIFTKLLSAKQSVFYPLHEASLSGGMYLITLRDSEGNAVVQKFVKQ